MPMNAGDDSQTAMKSKQQCQKKGFQHHGQQHTKAAAFQTLKTLLSSLCLCTSPHTAVLFCHPFPTRTPGQTINPLFTSNVQHIGYVTNPNQPQTEISQLKTKYNHQPCFTSIVRGHELP